MCATYACFDASSIIGSPISVFVSTELSAETFFHFICPFCPFFSILKLPQLWCSNFLSSFYVLHTLSPSGLLNFTSFSDLQPRVPYSNPFSIFLGDQGEHHLTHPVAALHYHVLSMLDKLQVSRAMFWRISFFSGLPLSICWLAFSVICHLFTVHLCCLTEDECSPMLWVPSYDLDSFADQLLYGNVQINQSSSKSN